MAFEFPAQGWGNESSAVTAQARPGPGGGSPRRRRCEPPLGGAAFSEAFSRLKPPPASGGSGSEGRVARAVLPACCRGRRGPGPQDRVTLITRLLGWNVPLEDAGDAWRSPAPAIRPIRGGAGRRLIALAGPGNGEGCKTCDVTWAEGATRCCAALRQAAAAPRRGGRRACPAHTPVGL